MNKDEMKIFFDDKENVNHIIDLESAEEVVKYLADNGIECDVQRAEALKKFLDSPSDAEILSRVPEEQLEEITGGKITAGKIAAGVAAGAVLIVGGKFIYDVYNDFDEHYSNSKSFCDGVEKGVKNGGRALKWLSDDIGFTHDNRNLWKKGVENTSKWINIQLK